MTRSWADTLSHCQGDWIKIVSWLAWMTDRVHWQRRIVAHAEIIGLELWEFLIWIIIYLEKVMQIELIGKKIFLFSNITSLINKTWPRKTLNLQAKGFRNRKNGKKQKEKEKRNQSIQEFVNYYLTHFFLKVVSLLLFHNRNFEIIL